MRQSHKKHTKRHLRKYSRRVKPRKFIGSGQIVSSNDLKNRHICEQKDDNYKTSPGYELYTSINTPFQLNAQTLDFFKYSFQKSHDKWFKFVLFNNSGTEYIYIINGCPINKHSVPVLVGLMEVTRETGEYSELRNVYQKLLSIKSLNGITNDIESNEWVVRLNEMIAQHIPCLSVISAGSGTVENDGNICINTKSGHYKPDEIHMELAKRAFETIVGTPTNIILKSDKQKLKLKYGSESENMSGMCM